MQPERDLRRRNILRRWPRFKWDSFGRPRLQVWTTSLLGLAFGLFALFPSIFFELYLRGEKLELLPFSSFWSIPYGQVALGTVVVLGAWLTDRLFEAQTELGARPPTWLRILRFVALMIPALGVITSLVLFKDLQEFPSTTRGKMGRPRLALERPAQSPVADSLRRLDHFLLVSSQSLWMFALWISLFHALPLFVMIQWLGRSAMVNPTARMSALILCVLLRIGAAGAFLVFANERSRELQLRRGQTVAVFFILLATLLPLPFSLVGLLALLYLSSSKFFIPEATALATIYKKHFSGRALLGITPTPLAIEIHGSLECRRSLFYTLKTMLLALEVLALAWLSAPWSGAASLSPISWKKLILFSFFTPIPGILLWVARFTNRVLQRWPSLDAIASIPHCTFHALVPLVVVQAFIAGSLAGLGYREAFAAFLETLRLESLCIGLLIGLLRVLLNLLTRAPTPWLTAMVIGATLSFFLLIPEAIAGVPAPGADLLLVGRYFCKPIFLGSPLLGFLFGHWLLAPFDLLQLFNRSIPSGFRAVLMFFAVPAVLPLGGLAIPLWILLHHILRSKGERPISEIRSIQPWRPL